MFGKLNGQYQVYSNPFVIFLNLKVVFFRAAHTANPDNQNLKDLEPFLSNVPHTPPAPSVTSRITQGSSSPKIGISKKSGVASRGEFYFTRVRICHRRMSQNPS